jgi:hypothetical protein
MNRWICMAFRPDADGHQRKMHAVSDELRIPLINEASDKGSGVRSASLLVRLVFEVMPDGPRHLYAPTLNIDDLGFELIMWCLDVPLIERKLATGYRRRFRGGLAHYRLEGFDRCLVLTEEQATTLRDAIRRERETVLRRLHWQVWPNHDKESECK